MRLSQIKIAGFKSFVDPTVIPVPGDLVGVVGPNGCGKSNVIDAVRWVLGESKASALRGDSMQDVIFSGSANRKPVGRASVELVFDNSLGKAAGQWSSYTEISIKRVIQRDGNSNYYINNIHVRRRDIADIFLGTGVGGRGYAIIEQGMISRIIEAKPQELRIFLEEAAGISKYRERRHETELRLADTRKNLLRIEDICQELKIQLAHLEEQAKIACQFKEIQAKLHTTQNLLWLKQKQDAIAQRTLAENEILRLEQELDSETSNLHHAEKQLEEARIQERETNENLHQAQGDLYSANAEIARIEQEIQYVRKNKERLFQQIADVEVQLERNQLQDKTAAENLTYWCQENEAAHLSHEAKVQKNSHENNKLPEVEVNLRVQQEALSSCQRDLLLIEQASHLENSHISHAAKTIQQLESRFERLANEQSTLPLPDLETLNQLNQEIEDIECILEQKKAVLEETENQLSIVIANKSQSLDEVQSIQKALTQSRARFDALLNLQTKLENNEALSNWLTKRQLDVLPRLWQNIQIDKKWENALESILRERLNSIGFKELEIIQDWLNDLPPGKWTLFVNNTSRIPEISAANHQEAASIQHLKSATLLGRIICTNTEIKSVLTEWLNKVFITESVQKGLSLRTELGLDETLITPEGHIFTRSSLTFYTPDSQLHGVLTRQQEIHQLQSEIDQLSANLNVQQAVLEEAEQFCEELNDAVRQLHQNNKQHQQQLHDLQLKRIKLSQLGEQVNQRHKQIENELAEIKQQLEVEISQKEKAQTKLSEHEKQIDILKDQVRQAQQTWKAADELLATQRQLVQNTLKEMQEAAFYARTCQNKINELEQTLQTINENTIRLAESKDKLQLEVEKLDETLLEDQLQSCLSQRLALEENAANSRYELESANNHLREIENARLGFEHKLHALRESINQFRLKEQEARILENRFAEQLNDVHADEEALLPLIEKARPAALQTEIKRFNTEIAALGAVNLAALEELEIARNREANLDSQLQDLNEAIATLENVIQQIDRETRERLMDTFNAVNNNLSEIFPVIFAGGQAKLNLNDGEILDSGVVLTAQPPGKKNSSIHLLSGGEKALTALALVFSLFQLNPAPFCLLDEVDAPLDDSNTGRFCDLVKKMSGQTQFLFISHNKITMEIAQQLVGITMQEQGVSRVVAVDIAEAIKLGKKENTV